MGMILGWLVSSSAGVIFKMFGDTIIQPLLQVYLKSKDVDLEKFKAANLSTQALAVAVLDANVRFAQIKSTYIMAVLQWWPFRVVLFFLLSFCAMRFILILIDSTWWWIFGCNIDSHRVIGDACSWSIPPIKGIYGGAEMQFLLFWIVAKPVDTAVTGGINLVSKYLNKK